MPARSSAQRSAQQRGRRAEDAAADYLARAGWELLGRNVRVGALELDLLVRRGDVVAVVEVRHRGSGAWQGALESIDARKRDRLREAARRLWDRRLRKDPRIQSVRFDVVVVTFADDGTPHVEHLEAAFQ